MKKVVLALMLFSFLQSVSAQDFEIVSVESLAADMSAREEMKTDHNDRQCALLRVATQNIVPEQREKFVFKADLGSEVVERASRNGEIWLWVSPGLKYLRIQHPDLGQYELRFLDYVNRVEALHTYKITIKGTLSLPLQEQGNKAPTQQYLAFRISPADAELEVDGEIWPLSLRGTARRRVNEGTYHYKVTALDCEDEEGVVSVVDTAVEVSVTLKPISKKPMNKPIVETKELEKETKQPQTEQPVAEKSYGRVFFVMANATYSIAPQTSFGLSVGSAKKLGWYASVNSNFKSKNADYECDFSGTIDGSGFEYSYSGEKTTSRFGATAGMVFRIYDPLYAYAGGGYGFRNVFWQLENGSWAKCTDDSCQGIAIDTGLMLHFGGFGFSLGVQTIGVKYMEAKIGIGYTLKRN